MRFTIPKYSRIHCLFFIFFQMLGLEDKAGANLFVTYNSPTKGNATRNVSHSIKKEVIVRLKRRTQNEKKIRNRIR